MARLLDFVAIHALLALGLLSTLLFVTVAAYALGGLARHRRYLAFALTLLLIPAAFSWTGMWLVCGVCSVIVVAQGTCYLYFSARTLLRRKQSPAPSAGALPSVAVVVAARDEAAVIEATLRSVDALDYPAELLEILVVDDGSSDGTSVLAAAVQRGARHRIRLQQHAKSGGKARRLNEVTSELTSELVLFLDADHEVKPDLVRRMVALLDGKPDVACVQVASSARNANQNLLTKLLEMEYLFRCYALYSGKQVAMFVGSGGMIRRAALREVGGFDPAMLTEDVEMSYRLYRAGYRVVYEDSLCTYDLAASTFKNFFFQRHRWMSGLWQAMALHRHEAERRARLGRVRAYYVQFCLDGFGALCLCVLMMYFALSVIGLLPFPATAVIAYMLAACGISFSIGCLRGGQPGKLLYLPLVPVYIIAHTIPMSWALIDSFLLAKPLTWVKTERRVTEPRMSASGERA